MDWVLLVKGRRKGHTRRLKSGKTVHVRATTTKVEKRGEEQKGYIRTEGIDFSAISRMFTKYSPVQAPSGHRTYEKKARTELLNYLYSNATGGKSDEAKRAWDEIESWARDHGSGDGKLAKSEGFDAKVCRAVKSAFIAQLNVYAKTTAASRLRQVFSEAFDEAFGK